uniref:Thioredoxin domain-containing protein n=1 Tax=Erythrolobus madagascarensis TaxID=708628 RepID=A0A7S0XN20_9RHOD|mmetsp:Transcript_3321/g.7191  ORF Transcript_3321/g.7191 Transcript_3321/m.7191 type:complete len:511 (+) Transcript_3321:3-1535(+)
MAGGFLSRYDVFAKLPLGDTRRTATGAFLSSIAVIVMVLVVILETRDFFSSVESSSVALDAYSENPLYVMFVINTPSAPCVALKVELHDAFGRVSTLGVRDNHKVRTSVWKTTTINGRPTGLFQGGAADGDAMENPLAAFLTRSTTRSQRAALGSSHGAVGAVRLDARSFYSETKVLPYAFVEFYSSKCLWCRKVAATYDTLALYTRHHKREVGVYKLDCDENTALCKAQQLSGVPTMRLFATTANDPPSSSRAGGIGMGAASSKDLKQIGDFTGRRTVEDMYEFLERMTTTTTQASGESSGSSSASSDVAGGGDDGEDEDVEGCTLTGVVETLRVPGSIRILTDLNAGSHGIDLASVNLSHTISHVSFDADMHGARHFTRRSGDALFSSTVLNKDELLTTHEHHFAVVPVVRRDFHTFFRSFHERTFFEFSGATFRTKSDPALPEIRISYDVASATVLVQRHARRRWYDFLTNLCAVLGGVFALAKALDTTLTGVLDSLLHKASSSTRR